MVFLPFTFRSIIFVSFLISLSGIYILSIRLKDRSDFSLTTGRIVYYSNNLKEPSTERTGKLRYLAVDSYPFVMELFIGKDIGDFSPMYENIDSLQIGDLVSIYYEDNPKIRNKRINYSVQFIDKGSINYYERGNKTIYLGSFIIVCSLSIVGIGYYLKRKGKIE
jgi:hypothetical protein